MDESEIIVIKDSVIPKISKLEIFGHRGYACFTGDTGVFAYRDQGVHFGKPYDKVRISLVFKKNDKVYLQFRKLKGKELLRKPPKHQERLGIPLELIAPMKVMLDLCINESGFSGNVSFEVDGAEVEKSEIDAMMSQLKPKGGRI